MRRLRWLILVLSLFAWVAWADIDPGNWELTATTELQGIKEPASFTQTRCLTPEDARDPSQLFGSSPGAGCQFLNRNDTGSVFTFEIECGSPQPIRGSGSVRYKRDSLEGELELKTDIFAARSRISGRRIGGC
jgi:Protein of unknown function (DUF3617)